MKIELNIQCTGEARASLEIEMEEERGRGEVGKQKSYKSEENDNCSVVMSGGQK